MIDSFAGPLGTGGNPAGGALVQRTIRLLGQVTDLDPHTVTLVRVVGLQALCLDVRMGQRPLPLTPRPGQVRPIAESAGAVAILRAIPVAAARVLLERFATHQAVTTDAIDEALGAISAMGGVHPSCVQLTDSHGIVQIGSPLAALGPESEFAAIVHLPERLANPSTRERASAALASLTAGLGAKFTS